MVIVLFKNQNRIFDRVISKKMTMRRGNEYNLVLICRGDLDVNRNHEIHIRDFSLFREFPFSKYLSCTLHGRSRLQGWAIPGDAARQRELERRTAERDACPAAWLAVTFPTHRLHTICVSSNAYACSGASTREAVVAIGLFDGAERIERL